MKKKKPGKDSETNSARKKSSRNDLILDKFAGDQDKIIEPNLKPWIFIVPPFAIAGACWLVGIRSAFPLAVLIPFFWFIISGLLYYLFYAESDYLIGSLMNLFKRR